MTVYEPQMPPGAQWADELPGHFWEHLQDRPPELAAAATGAALDQGRFVLPVFARPYLVDPGRRLVQDISRPEERVDYNTALVLVTHLTRAGEIPPAGRMLSLAELPGGRALLSGPHALPLEAVSEHFGRNPEALVQRARELGGDKYDGADVAVCLPGLPRVPLYLLLWVADEEFPAQAVPGVDANVLHHLGLDGLLSLAHLMVQQLTERPA
jgi:hypothetical protein